MLAQGAIQKTVGVVLAVLVIASGCSSEGDLRSSTPSDTAATTSTSATTTPDATPATSSPTATASVNQHLICSEPLRGEVLLADTSLLANPADDRSNWPESGSYAPFDERDGPASDYTPCYVSADDADFDDDTVVLGIAIDGEARAFARAQLIAHLVNDRIGQTPILATY